MLEKAVSEALYTDLLLRVEFQDIWYLVSTKYMLHHLLLLEREAFCDVLAPLTHLIFSII